MKNWLFVIGLALLLTGCIEKSAGTADDQNDVVDPVDESPTDGAEKKEPKAVKRMLDVDAATFHFVSDWLSDTEIVYIEKNNGHYQVKRFDLKSGNSDTLYEDASMIIDVQVHPSKQYLLIHTSDNPTSAIIKILSLNGLVQDEIEIASSELAIEWNDLDPTLMLLTAFYEDWSFDLFLYDGNEKDISLLKLENPFPKWIGDEKLVVGQVENHELDGAELRIYEPNTGNWGDSIADGVVYFDTYENRIVTVEIESETEAHYSLMDENGIVLAEWTTPAISNYSEWIIPEMTWLSTDTIVLPVSESGGQLDDLTSPFQLVSVIDGLQKVISDQVDASPILCAPSGGQCLTGYGLDRLVDMETGEVYPWLTIRE